MQLARLLARLSPDSSRRRGRRCSGAQGGGLRGVSPVVCCAYAVGLLLGCRPSAPSDEPGVSRRETAAGAVRGDARPAERRDLPPGLPLGGETCFNATDDNDNRLIDEGCEVRQGAIHVAIAWTEADADVDLYVLGPDGQLAEFGEKTSVGLIRSGDCPTVDRSCPVHRFESVHLEGDEVAPGRYEVRVRLESAPRPEILPDEPLRVRLGIRTPEETKGQLVSFYAEGTETTLSFEIPPPSTGAPRATSESSEPGGASADLVPATAGRQREDR